MFRRAGYSIAIMLSISFALAPGTCHSQGILQPVSDWGVIDWQKMVIRCTGVGLSTAESRSRQEGVIESARADALDKLLKSLREIAVSSEVRVGQLMDKNPSLQVEAQRLLQEFRETGVHYMSDGSVEIEVEFCFGGKLEDLLLPATGAGKRVTDGLLCPLCGQPWPEDKEAPRDLRLVVPDGDIVEPFSGLVIDARGLGLTPALAPKVLNKEGKTIYGVEFADRRRALEQGLVGYESDIDRACTMDRVGSRPLVVDALKARGVNKIDVSIDDLHAAILHATQEHLQFMEQCRVILVLE